MTTAFVSLKQPIFQPPIGFADGIPVIQIGTIKKGNPSQKLLLSTTHRAAEPRTLARRQLS
jgi:hypothetical protein